MSGVGATQALLLSVNLLFAPVDGPGSTAAFRAPASHRELVKPTINTGAVLSSFSPAEDASPSSIAGILGAAKKNLTDRIDSILRQPRYRNAFWGIDVYSLDYGETLYSHNSEKYFFPASNVKVFTTAAALDRLGPDFRFQTHVGYEGQLDDEGVLRGDLVLSGEGDPDLANQFGDAEGTFLHMDQIVERIRQFGVKRIEGGVIGDDTYFEHLPHGRGWTEADLNRYYGAPVSALSFNDNLVTLAVRPGRAVGQPNVVSISPATSLLRVVNRTSTAPAGSNQTAHWFRRRDSNVITLTGGVAMGSRGWSRVLPVANPAQYTAGILRDRLRKAGISVSGGVSSRQSSDPPPSRTLVEIYVHASMPLIDIVAQVNKRSQNLYAEILLRTLGAQFRGRGTDEAGLQVLYAFLSEAGISPVMVDLYDGSGLSRNNLITPRAETLLLAHLAGTSYFPQFLESLAISGQDGTLRRRMGRGVTSQRIFAKTGTLNSVSTLGGYVLTESGQTLAFSIFVNDYSFSPVTAHRAVDEICAILARF